MSQEQIPTNYDFSYQEPDLLITDVNDVELFRYQSEGVWPAGTRDFDLNSLVLHYGVNDDFGSLGINIQDDNLALTKSDFSQECIIPRYANVQLSLGKTLAGVTRWFYGKIMQASVFRPDGNSQQIDLYCIGWGQKARDRITDFRRFQNLQSDNITVDATDTKTRADILFSEIWESSEHYALQSLPIPTEITSIPTIQTFKFKEFEQRWQSWAATASLIAAGIGGYWGIDYDRKATLNKILSKNSGFLFTSDFEGILTKNWNSAKLGIIKRNTISWGHSIMDQNYNVLIAHGVNEDRLDIDNTGSEDASFDMSTKNVAAAVIPLDSSLSKIGIYIRRLGTPADDAFISLMSDSGSGPRSKDLIRRVRIPKAQLQALSDSVDSLIQVSFEAIQLVAGSTYFIVLEKYGTASNTIEWAYEVGAGTFYTANTVGGTWTIDGTGGKFSIITNPSRLTNVVLVNTTALRKANGEVREKLIPLRQGMDETAAADILIGLADLLTKERRIMPNLSIYIPDTRIPTGEYCLITDNKGLRVKADIIGVNLIINAYDKTQSIGAMTCDLTLQVFE